MHQGGRGLDDNSNLDDFFVEGSKNTKIKNNPGVN